jgi:hypothetical protein
VGAIALDSKNVRTSEEIVVPSKHKRIGNGKTQVNAEKNFSALLMPATCQPVTKSNLLGIIYILANFR